MQYFLFSCLWPALTGPEERERAVNRPSLAQGRVTPLPPLRHWWCDSITFLSGNRREKLPFLQHYLSLVSCIGKVQSELKTGSNYRTVDLSLFNLPCRYKTRKHCWSVSFVKLNSTLLWQSEQSLQLGCWRVGVFFVFSTYQDFHYSSSNLL